MSNPYFNFFSQNNTNEFNLFNNLSSEIINIYGIDCYYMPRNKRKDDMLFGDAIGSYFTGDNSFMISMYLENPLDFENDEMFSKFGIQTTNNVNFIVNMSDIHQAIGDRPFTGDLIYVPNFNRVFSVSKAEEKYTLYMTGRLMNYKIVCNLLELSDETFEDTPFSELDSLNAMTSISPTYSDNISATTATLYIDFGETRPF